MKVVRDWVDDAACLDMKQDIFFPEQSFLGYIQDQKIKAAKRVCATCPVSGPCLQDALRMKKIDDVAGIRGGLTVEERDAYRREHRIKPDPNWKPPRIRGVLPENRIELPTGTEV